jgi:hypothetical protein
MAGARALTDEDLESLERYCAATENAMLDEALKDYPAPRTSALAHRFVDLGEKAALLDYASGREPWPR